VKRAGRIPCLAASALAIAFLACGPVASAQVTHSEFGDPKLQDSGAFASNPSGAIEAARKLVAAGQLDAAVKALATYVAAHPREIEPARYLGDLYFRQSDIATAERTYLAILKIAPGDRETLNRLGGIYAAQDRITEAIDAFQRSLPSMGAYERLVDLHRRRGDLANFENEYRRQAELRPSEAGPQYALGTVLRAEHRPLDAISYLQRALDIQPRSCQSLSELGSAYLDINKVSLAIGTLQRCLVVEPDNYSALVNIGDAYIDAGQIATARDSLEHANRVRSDGFEALVDIGYLEDLAGRWQSAVQYYLRAIAVDPLARDAYVNLGYDYDEHRLYALAEAAFLKGLSVAPFDGRLHYLLGVTYAEQGKRDLAKAEYVRARDSDEPEVARAANRDLALMQSTSGGGNSH